jgi:threonine synthase
MRYSSTRGGQGTSLVDAVMRGLAADGGLYVPDELPWFDASAVRGESLAEIAAEVLAPFFDGSGLETELGAICRDAFDFPLPLKELAPNGELAVLELFHGPTAAFKDVGARFLAALMERALRGSTDSRALTILVATSGDTGGAVAAAFHRRRGIRVGVAPARAHAEGGRDGGSAGEMSFDSRGRKAAAARAARTRAAG